MLRNLICGGVLALTWISVQAIRAEVLEVRIYSEVYSQASVIAGKRVISRSNWMKPHEDRSQPNVVKLPTNTFPCSIRVRWANGTYEFFGPIKRDSGFDGNRNLVVTLKPVWETRTNEYVANVWDSRRGCWIWRRFTRECKVSKFVPDWEEEGYILPHEEDDVESRMYPTPPAGEIAPN